MHGLDDSKFLWPVLCLKIFQAVFCLLCLNPEAEFCEEEERLSLSLSSGAREGGDKKLCNFDLWQKKIVCQRETQNSDRDRDRGGIGSNEFCVRLVFGYVMELWILPEGCKNLVSWSRQCGQDYPSSHAQGWGGFWILFFFAKGFFFLAGSCSVLGSLIFSSFKYYFVLGFFSI